MAASIKNLKPKAKKTSAPAKVNYHPKGYSDAKPKTASAVQKLTPAEAASVNKGKTYMAVKSKSGAYTPLPATPGARVQAAANRGNAAEARKAKPTGSIRRNAPKPATKLMPARPGRADMPLQGKLKPMPAQRSPKAPARKPMISRRSGF